MIVAGYARVSTSEQAVNSHALEQQQQRLVAAGATDLFCDVLSGTSRKRPKFKELCDRIQSGDVKEVVATRVDRIARSLLQLREFAELCADYEVNLRILDQNIDLSTPHGKLMLNMLGSVAEWEVDLLKSRVNHGLTHMRAESRVPGIIPFGYTKDDSEKYARDLSIYKETGKTRWAIAREIIETFLRVGTVRGTVREMESVYGKRDPKLPRWHQGEFPREIGLKYWLENPVLRGHTGYYYRHRRKETQPVMNTHESLISPGEWQEIQKHLSIHGSKNRKDSEPLPLAGLVYCSKCGGKYKAYRHTKKNGRVIIRWYCSNKHTPIAGCEGWGGIRNERLEEEAIGALVQKSFEVAETMDIKSLEIKETDELREARLALASMEMLPPNPFLERSIEQLKAEITIMERRSMDDAIVHQDLEIELSHTIANPRYWDDLRRIGELRRVFRKYISQIIVGGNGVEVKLLV